MCNECITRKHFYCGEPELTELTDLTELTEIVQKYFSCQLMCGYRTAREAFMDTVEIYMRISPQTPEWLAPKRVAEILNPNLVL